MLNVCLDVLLSHERVLRDSGFIPIEPVPVIKAYIICMPKTNDVKLFFFFFFLFLFFLFFFFFLVLLLLSLPSPRVPPFLVRNLSWHSFRISIRHNLLLFLLVLLPIL